MPFESDRQRRYMYAKHPKIARRWAKEARRGSKVLSVVDNKITRHPAFHSTADIATIGGLGVAVHALHNEQKKNKEPVTKAFGLMPKIRSITPPTASRGETWKKRAAVGGLAAAMVMPGAHAAGLNAMKLAPAIHADAGYSVSSAMRSIGGSRSMGRAPIRNSMPSYTMIKAMEGHGDKVKVSKMDLVDIAKANFSMPRVRSITVPGTDISRVRPLKTRHESYAPASLPLNSFSAAPSPLKLQTRPPRA